MAITISGHPIDKITIPTRALAAGLQPPQRPNTDHWSRHQYPTQTRQPLRIRRFMYLARRNFALVLILDDQDPKNRISLIIGHFCRNLARLKGCGGLTGGYPTQ